MAPLADHPLRALSPITELTTPNSLRTLQLPVDESDNHSERRTSNDIDQDDGDSVYSQQSIDTIRNEDDGTSMTPQLRQRTLSLPASSPASRPSLPPRSPGRPLPTSQPQPRWPKTTTSLNNRIGLTRPLSISRQHHTGTPPPGGLPPPPRSQIPTRPKLIPRITPPPTPTRFDSGMEISNQGTKDDNVRTSDEQSIIEGQNMAGIGAGKSLSLENNSQSDDNTSRTSQGEYRSKILIKVHPEPGLNLHNVPILDQHTYAQQNARPPRSRPNSLKKPQPINNRIRPNSFHGTSITQPLHIEATTGLGTDPITTTSAHIQADIGVVDELNVIPNAHDTIRPALSSHQSESSLPSRITRTNSTSSANSSTRRKRVSSLLSTIFGVDHNKDKDRVSRKLSKASRNSNGSGVKSRGSSRAASPNEPSDGIPVSPVEDEQERPIQSAIRTSGTFGIMDDGSILSTNAEVGLDNSGLPNTPDSTSRHDHDRAEMSNGSIKTESDGIRRMLYVENMVKTPEHEEAEKVEISEEKAKGKSRESSNNSSNTNTPSTSTTTPPRSRVTPVAIFGTLPSPPPTFVSPRPVSYHAPHAVSLGEPLMLDVSTSTSSGTSSNDQENAGVHSDLQRDLPINTQEPSKRLTDEYLRLMMEQSYQTSAQPSPANSVKSRPLPRPPSNAPSPVGTPKPTYVRPFTPSTGSTPELPLLIASHLLSTHAAALIRHSSNMKEASETMHKMAKESLDWGGILMNMAQKKGNGLDGLPKIHRQHGYDGTPLPNLVPATSSSFRSNLARPETFGNGKQRDDEHSGNPIEEAYNTLTRDTNIPSHSANNSLRPISRAEIRKKRGESLPADLLREAQRLGNEGWNNLHKAEEAWSGAMKGLADIMHSQGLDVNDEANDPSLRSDTLNNTSSTGNFDSILPIGITPDPMIYSKPDNTQYPPKIPVSPRSNLSYSLGSPNTVHGHTSMSFLPDDYDMRRSPPITPPIKNPTFYPFPTPHVNEQQQVHPFQNPYTGILSPAPIPSDQQHNNNIDQGSQSTIKARPQSIQVFPTSQLFRDLPGVSTIPLSSASGTATGTDESRMTRSSMTSSSLHSHSHTNSLSPKGLQTMKNDSTLRSTTGSNNSNNSATRRLAKKQPPPPSSISKGGSVNKISKVLGDDYGTINQRNNGDTVGKKHWWSRKKEGN
ncbi:uncharacterized protein L201_000605 [Kwoniella dendrophila CBS 6074]|uniref:Uncharacterized protein n=1 Tax=Kwoniella dendrophila CBS 6074 TaxID=1295534 RepID=A0AAX4JK08_9TREE